MFIHYLSCHQTLEYNEVSLLIELGHDVFVNGAYVNGWHSGLARPAIPGQKLYPELAELSTRFPKTELPPELIEPFDLIFVMGGITDNVLVENWPRIKHKKVVWRTIGQSTPATERMMKPLRDDGLKIIRYSPKERNIPNYCGEDTLIRFHADPEDLTPWNGKEKRVINITQSLRGRRHHTHYDHIIEATAGFDTKIYGTGNDDLGNLNGGELPYDLLKGALRDNRVFFYGGTWPASYTLSFIDAFMVGIPIVSISHKLAQAVPGTEPLDFFEVPDLIEHGVDGFVGDDMNELRSYISQLMSNYELAKKISERARSKAIHIFGKQNIIGEWSKFLNSL